MNNERKNENLVRDQLRELGYYDDKKIVVEEQRSDNPRIRELLKHASKKGMTGDFTEDELGPGKPEFTITSSRYPRIVIVHECKANTKDHQRAINEVNYYAKFLTNNYDVISIATSGETEKEFRVSVYFHSNSITGVIEIVDVYGKVLSKLHTFDEYVTYMDVKEDMVEMKTKSAKFGKELHSFMRTHGGLVGDEKAILISAILIGLKNDGFRKIYKNFEDKSILGDELVSATRRVLDTFDLPPKSTSYIINSFSFIKIHPELNKLDTRGETPLSKIISNVYEEFIDFILGKHTYDVTYQFFIEFLNHSGGGYQSLGIIPTPQHITELFCGIEDLTVDSVVLDTCVGTGGFLTAAVENMINKASSAEEIDQIKKMSVIGIETAPVMYTLGLTSMIISGLEKTSLYLGSCFNQDIVVDVKNKATVVFINPPYGQGKGSTVIDFINNALDLLPKGKKCIALVPIGITNITNNPRGRKKLLESHRLDAVMTLNPQLFGRAAGVAPCILVLTAHIPHLEQDYHTTWLADWKDDGFKNVIREDRIPPSNWDEISLTWLTDYHNKKEVDSMSGSYHLTCNDDWYPEAYLKHGLVNIDKINKETISEIELEYEKVINPSKKKELCSSRFEGETVRFSALFEFKKAVTIKGKKIECDRNDPEAVSLVQRKSINLGIEKFVKRHANSEPIPGGNISISLMGLNIFIQPWDFYCNTGVRWLKPKHEMSRKEILYYLACLEGYKDIYGYGKTPSIKEVNEMLLPKTLPQEIRGK